MLCYLHLGSSSKKTATSPPEPWAQRVRLTSEAYISRHLLTLCSPLRLLAQREREREEKRPPLSSPPQKEKERKKEKQTINFRAFSANFLRLRHRFANPMPRASGAPTPPAAAAKNVSSNAVHSEPSCSTPAYQQAFRPVTRSMTRMPAAIAALPDVKEGESASTSSCKSTLDACFSIQSAASRPTVTRVRTPQKVISSAWKPLTQPAVLSEELKRASIPTNNPTAKRTRVASSQAAKDPTNNSASKANPNVPTGKKNRNEDCVSQGDHLDGAVIPSPPKKLQRGKSPSDAVSKRKATIRSHGAKLAASLPTGKSRTESGKNSASVLSKVASANDDSQSVESVVPLLAQQLQLETAKDFTVITKAIANRTSQVNQLVAPVITEAIGNATSQVNQSVAPVITEAIANRTSLVNQLVAPVITLPRQNLQTDNQKKLAKVPMTTNQVRVGAMGPLVAPKLQIGNVKDSSNVLSNPAYRRALSIKQQEQLLQQYKLQNSQPQLHIKGPALSSDHDAPPMEPLGTRCQLCKLDVAFRPQGDAGHDAAAPPVVAVLACHHAFHSSCIEAVYGLAEPSQCIACLDSVTAQ